MDWDVVTIGFRYGGTVVEAMSVCGMHVVDERANLQIAS